MPTKPLPAQADPDRLKSDARRLLLQRQTADAQACQRIREFHPRYAHASDADIAVADLAWSDALFVIAREHGFASWARLRKHLASSAAAGREDSYTARIADPVLRSAVEALEDGDVASLRHALYAHADLLNRRAKFDGQNYFRSPALLAFIAENPIRTESLPPNILDIARLLLERGAAKSQSDLNETLALVSSGRVPREAGVQDALIEMLCAAGAQPDAAIIPALAHGEFAAARRLLKCGAKPSLPAAAALSDIKSAMRAADSSSGGDRHAALALAAQHGKDDVLDWLLREQEDPNRYNPVGMHAHSTPLHQAAFNGHAGAVRILLDHGADPTLKDLIWNGTPLDWARFAGQDSVVRLLEQHRGS